MTGDLRFSRIRQPEFLQSDPCTAARSDIGIDNRKESVNNYLLEFLACESITESAANNRTPATCKGNHHTLPIRIGEQIFFRHATLLGQRLPPLGIQSSALCES